MPGRPAHRGGSRHGPSETKRRLTMSKRGRKRKDRRKNSANHGKRPNS